MVFDFSEWHLQKKAGEIVIDFSGEITTEIIANTLNSIERHFNTINEKGALKKKVYNVVVECLQNLFHHSDTQLLEDEQEGLPRFGTLIMSKEGTFYRISTGNFLKSEKQLMLKDRIDQLNSLSDEEVRTLYRDILSNDEFSKKGGGGLGMLDIVRKTGNKLNYQFYPVNSGVIFFSLDVYIS